ncbi:MAG TPA: D-alanyl-D-alanine carboxypeptidase [Blastocatellia bacterium]|nr:D-alanyl-D-alanine carboxypeptidase [Blastocatellia bacterium]
MTVARIPISKFICILITLTLTSSLALAAPAGRSSKSRKASAHSAKKSSKSKAKARGSKATARARSGKASRVAKRSERGRGRRVVYARGRGRYKGGRYRKHYVVSRPASSHGSGVHKFLADAWTREQGTADTNAAASQELSTPSLTAVGPDSSHAVTGESAASLANDVAKPKQLDPAQTTEELPLNPLVAAYTESLAARGFAADNQGFIVTTLRGEVLAEHNADKLFNPASVTKIATSLTAISRLGPDFKFRTSLYTDGALDQSTGILRGSLYVIGSGDPAFFYENAMMIADKLNRAGIREVEGDLIVLGHFYFNFSTSLENSAKALRNVLSSDTWSAAAKSAYPRFLSMRAAEDTNAQQSGAQLAPISPGLPSLRIAGKTITSSTVNTTSLTPLAVHTSLPLLRVLKGLNDFSNNWMATVIGDLVGGTDAVERFLKMEVGFKEDEVQFATPSGLGANYISPRGTISMLRKLITYLDGKGLQLENILPVAGVDQGTLQRRFTDAFRGSVVAKTGTLSSVSALAGVAYTRLRGPLMFVIYNRGGSAHSFRAAQDETIKKLITLYGGPVPIRYTPSAGARASQRTVEQNTHLLSSPAPRQ